MNFFFITILCSPPPSFSWTQGPLSLSLSLSVYIRYVYCVNVLNCASNGFGFIVGCHVKQ